MSKSIIPLPVFITRFSFVILIVYIFKKHCSFNKLKIIDVKMYNSTVLLYGNKNNTVYS